MSFIWKSVRIGQLSRYYQSVAHPVRFTINVEKIFFISNIWILDINKSFSDINHWFFDIRKIIFFDITNSISWYLKMIFDIKKLYFLILEKSIFWYQKIRPIKKCDRLNECSLWYSFQLPARNLMRTCKCVHDGKFFLFYDGM